MTAMHISSLQSNNHHFLLCSTSTASPTPLINGTSLKLTTRRHKSNGLTCQSSSYRMMYEALKFAQEQLGERQQNTKSLSIPRAAPSAYSDHPLRRTANYRPTIWDYDFIQSLSSNFVGENYRRKANKLKEKVRVMLDDDKVKNPLAALQLIDVLQRLGISYHFEDRISEIMHNIYNDYDYGSPDNLYESFLYKALVFRLLRQHSLNIPQDIFDEFKEENRNFKEVVFEDIEVILNLYEASFLSVEGEKFMEYAKNVTTRHLKEYLETNPKDHYISALVSHSLELPLHWRVPRLEARWFIDVYERCHDMNPLLLEFAKLDFNMVQAIHQEDLKYASRWWKHTCWGEKLTFARDRLMENFLWTIGVNFNPQLGYLRRTLTKVNALITTIDDVYDVYGTLEELEQFTNQTIRWDINGIESFPDYVKICYLAFYNSINEISYESLTKQGVLILPYLKKAWTDLCKSYLVEAKWYHSGYKPTLEEYMENAWISIAAPVILAHAYFVTTNDITDQGQCLNVYPNIVRYPAMILRLADDLGTSKDELERGDNPKSIQCYMNENGASEEEAREYIKYLIGETWKKMNKERLMDSPFSKTFIETSMNLARMAQCMYQHGDGHASQGSVTRERVLSLLIDPIKGV